MAGWNNYKSKEKIANIVSILTLSEYLVDYATPQVQTKGWKLINKTLENLNSQGNPVEIRGRIERIKQGERDLYF